MRTGSWFFPFSLSEREKRKRNKNKAKQMRNKKDKEKSKKFVQTQIVEENLCLMQTGPNRIERTSERRSKNNFLSKPITNKCESSCSYSSVRYWTWYTVWSMCSWHLQKYCYYSTHTTENTEKYIYQKVDGFANSSRQTIQIPCHRSLF